MFLVDRACHPAPAALSSSKRVQDPHFTTELGLFQIEMNADPQPFAGHGLRQMEAQLTDLFDKARVACAELERRARARGHPADDREDRSRPAQHGPEPALHDAQPAR